LAFFYENVINLRARYDASLVRQASQEYQDSGVKAVANAGSCCSPSTTPAAAASSGDFCECPTTVNMRRPFTTTQCLIRSTLFAFSNFYSLFLMMIFMTYNAYLCIALVMGAGAGHFWSSVFIPEADIMNRPRSCCN
jgi:copper transporter 1